MYLHDRRVGYVDDHREMVDVDRGKSNASPCHRESGVRKPFGHRNTPSVEHTQY